jgi:putative NIF3 family GTP cyclohydrolase 1 type 2
VKEVFGCGVVRHTAVCKERVRRVAVCGGAGAFLTREAIARGADIYITGDYKYHDFFMAENRIILADIGHYESEQFTKEVIFELLVKNLSNFAVQFSKVRTNPVYYL